MEDLGGIWAFLLIAVVAVAAGAGVGMLLGGANSDPFETVIETVTGKRRTVTKTETKTVTKTETETVTDAEASPEPVDGDGGTDDDADADGCSDSYADACVDPSGGSSSVDCTEIPERDFSSIGDDPHGLDPDFDGVACEAQ